MMKLIVLLVCMISLSAAAPFGGYWQGNPYNYYNGGYYGAGYHHPYHYTGYGHFPHGVTPNDRWIYHGSYPGSCAGSPDGLYYVDEYNFAYCSNGQKTIQPCAEGSANPSLNYFTHGGYYGFYDFCGVNLVALGYNDNQGKVVPVLPQVVDESGYTGDKHDYSEDKTLIVEEEHKYGNEAPPKPIRHVEGYANGFIGAGENFLDKIVY